MKPKPKRKTEDIDVDAINRELEHIIRSQNLDQDASKWAEIAQDLDNNLLLEQIESLVSEVNQQNDGRANISFSG